LLRPGAVDLTGADGCAARDNSGNCSFILGLLVKARFFRIVARALSETTVVSVGGNDCRKSHGNDSNSWGLAKMSRFTKADASVAAALRSVAWTAGVDAKTTTATPKLNVLFMFIVVNM